MLKKLILLIIAGLFLMSCSQKDTNPFLSEWDTPFGTPPFDKIKQEHYKPAFDEAVKQHKAEIDAIINNKETATFVNTIEALDYSGALLTKVTRVFSAMNESMTNDEMQALSKEIYPMLSKHNDDINLNPELFKRVKAVYDMKDQLDLTTEQSRLLDDYYKSFVRGGANLNDEDKKEFRKINEELSLLSLQFGENVLKETNKFEMVLEEGDLDGLPENVREMGASDAKDRGYDGKYVYTINRPSMYPFLTYSTRRDLREKLYKGYINKGDNGDSLDNNQNLSKMAALRVKRANLLGFPTHAHYVLDEQMAKEPKNVFDLLNKLWTPALNVAKQERADMQKIIDEEGGKFKLKSWDWWYYADKVKKAKYDLDEEELRPYFEVTNVINGVFGLSTKLWGNYLRRTPRYSQVSP